MSKEIYEHLYNPCGVTLLKCNIIRGLEDNKIKIRLAGRTTYKEVCANDVYNTYDDNVETQEAKKGFYSKRYKLKAEKRKD